MKGLEHYHLGALNSVFFLANLCMREIRAHSTNYKVAITFANQVGQNTKAALPRDRRNHFPHQQEQQNDSVRAQLNQNIIFI